MEEDQEKLIMDLAAAIAKALRTLTIGIEKKAGDLALPVGSDIDIATTSTTLPPLETTVRSNSTVQALTAKDSISQFTTLDPPEFSPTPTRDSPHPDVVKPVPFFQSAPATAEKPLELPAPPHPEAFSAPPFERHSPPLALPDFSQVDMRRGFASDDPGGFKDLRHEQMAESQRYDQTTQLLFEAMVHQGRIDRDYRQSNYQLHRQNNLDLNNDNRRLEDLERRAECSRETITDANV